MCVRKTFNYRFYFFNSHMIIKVICYLLENKIKNYNGNNNMNKRICTNKIGNLIEVENLRFRISSRGGSSVVCFPPIYLMPLII